MAIKSGELLHVGNTVLLDRIQTGGPAAPNIPTEKIKELGNYKGVATIRDIPDLSFSLESLDVSAELEALLVNANFGTDAAGTEYDLSKVLPIDVAGQFKAGATAASPNNVVVSAAVPFLLLESLSYRFGLRDNATQSATLRTDTIFWAEGSVYIVTAAGTGSNNQLVPFGQTALPYNGDTIAGTRYALSVTLVESSRRLVPGVDYTETATGVTILVGTTNTIRVVIQSATPAVYPAASHAAASATRPAAVKGRDIEIRVGGNTVTDRWSSVQSVTIDWRGTVERDEELGSSQIIDQSFDIPEVSGSVELKPRDGAELMRRIRQVANVPSGQVVGPHTSTPLSLDVLIHSPDDGSVVKTLHVPDARFVIPGYSGQVDQSQTVTLNFDSDTGDLRAYKGARA